MRRIIRKIGLVALLLWLYFGWHFGPTPLLAQSAPTAPLLQNIEQRWHWGGLISTLIPVSNTLYVGMGQGIAILDITEPAAPKQLSQLNLNAFVADLEIVGQYALIAAGDKGLLIVDIHDKHAPRLVAAYQDPATIINIAVAAPYAYLTYQKFTDTAIVNSIEILDVTYPEAPTVVNPQLAGIDDFAPEDLQIANGYLFVAGGKYEPGRYSSFRGVFQAFRLTDPTAPTPLAAYRTEPGDYQTFYDLRLQGDNAYLARRDGVYKFAISTPATLTLSSRYPSTATLTSSTLAVVGDQLYIAQQIYNNNGGIYILNPSTAPTITVSNFLTQPVQALAVQGHYAFIARNDDGLHIWDVTQPLTPHEIGSYKNRLSLGGDLVAHEPFLYATGGIWGTPIVSAIDLHKPDEPTLTTVITGTDSGAFYSFIDDHWLLLSARSPTSRANFDNLQFFDIANPSAPQRISRYETVPFSNAAYGNHGLYVENFTPWVESGEMRIFDLVPPQAPVLTKSFSMSKSPLGNFNDIGVTSDYVYYTGYPTTPPSPFSAKTVQTNYLYVYDRTKAETITAVELPEALYSLYDFDDMVYGVAVSLYGQCRYIIYMFDVSTPAKPALRQSYCWTKTISDLIRDGNLLYIADSNVDYTGRNPGGLSVLDFTLPHAPSLAGYAIEDGINPQLARINDTIYFLGNGLSAYRYKPPQAAAQLAQGGQLSANVDPVTYTFPAASFATPVTVTHTTHFADPWLAFGAPMYGVGHAFSLASKSVATGEAIQPTGGFSLTVTYPSDVTPLVDETTLALYRWTAGAWVLEKTSRVDPATHTVVASPTTPGLWMVGGVLRNRLYLPLIGH